MDIDLIQYIQAISSDLFYFLLGATVSWFLTMRYHREALEVRKEALEAKQRTIEEALIAKQRTIEEAFEIRQKLSDEALAIKQEAVNEAFKANQESIRAKDEQIEHLKKLIESGDRDLAWFQREHQLLQQALLAHLS